MKNQLILLVLHLLRLCATGKKEQQVALGTEGMVKYQHDMVDKNIRSVEWSLNNGRIAYIVVNGQDINLQVEPRYRVDRGKGVVYLYIKKVEKQDGGTYRCKVTSDDDERTRQIEVRVEEPGFVSVQATSEPVKSSLAALLIGSVLQIVLLAI